MRGAGFEPNPAHAPRLQSLGSRLRALGRRVEFFAPYAASDRPGTKWMCHSAADLKAGANRSSEWGFSSGGALGLAPSTGGGGVRLASNVTYKVKTGRDGVPYAKPRGSAAYVHWLEEKHEAQKNASAPAGGGHWCASRVQVPT